MDLLIHRQDIRQYHFLGDQNLAEDCYEEEAYGHDEKGRRRHALQPDLGGSNTSCWSSSSRWLLAFSS